MPAKKKPDARSETVTVRLEPKLHYLAGIAARESQRTLSAFIEWSVRKVLTQGTIDDEPEYDRRVQPAGKSPLWNEGLWDVDEGDRFYLLAASRPDLLTIAEQRLWKLFNLHMEHTKSKLTIAAFRKFWSNDSVETNHLKEGA